MRNRLLSLLVVIIGGCGSSTHSDKSDLAMASADLATPADLEPAIPGGPALQLAHPAHGIFNLSWTIPAAGCDMIAVDRRIGSSAFSTLTTVSGTTTTYDDVDHVDSGTFCYQVQCQSTSHATLPSNQACAGQ
jgi:hypothetical protein